jgi:hypothetical protein
MLRIALPPHCRQVDAPRFAPLPLLPLMPLMPLMPLSLRVEAHPYQPGGCRSLAAHPPAMGLVRSVFGLCGKAVGG